MLARATKEFYAALAYGQTVTSTVSLWYDGEQIDPLLPVVDGSVDFDRTRAIRRSTSDLSIVCVDEKGRSLVPKTITSRLAPYGAELFLQRGVKINGEMWMAPLGWLRISECDLENVGGVVTLSVTAYDRSRTISRARFIDTWVVLAGTNYLTAMQDIVDYAMPGTEIAVEGEVVTATTPLLVFEGQSDPWEALRKMATALGSEIFYKPDGALVLRPEPDPAVDSAIDHGFIVGHDTCRVTKLGKGLSDSPGYNGVVVVGNPPNVAPVRAVYWDEDPASPTYHLGPYGKVPRFYTSEYITTEEQAFAAGRALYLKERGGTEKVRYESIVNPLADGSDIVPLFDPALGISSNYLLESGKIPLRAKSPATGVMAHRTAA